MCDTDNTDILRCDTDGRYLFVRVSAPCGIALYLALPVNTGTSLDC